jgi:hypothetical protein
VKVKVKGASEAWPTMANTKVKTTTKSPPSDQFKSNSNNHEGIVFFYTDKKELQHSKMGADTL